MRIASACVLFVLFTLQILHAQDTINKTINTREFDLRTYGIKHNLIYYNCNKIIPVSDSSFFTGKRVSSKLVLYKDIRRIDIQSDKSRTWEGVWKGALAGGFAGLFAMLFFQDTFLHPDNKEVGSGTISLIMTESIFMASGSLIGGIIGSTISYTDYYDLTKYKPEQRKQKALSIFLKYKIDL